LISACAKYGGDGLAQLGKTLRGAVLGPAFIQSLLARFYYMFWGGEVGLADLQVDDVLSLLIERSGLDQALEGRFHPNTGHRFDKLHVRF
jgi:hypothetical protein